MSPHRESFLSGTEQTQVTRRAVALEGGVIAQGLTRSKGGHLRYELWSLAAPGHAREHWPPRCPNARAPLQDTPRRR